MIDSVLKGTGNSRFLKSAVPAGTSWADALAMLQAGTFPIDFNGINAEGFQQVGTPLNKANLLKDATAAQIGLPPSTTPDGMFRALGNTGELHVWRKTTISQQAGYNLGNIVRGTFWLVSGSDQHVTYQVSASLDVSSDGTIALRSPNTVTINESDSASAANSALKGKFVKRTGQVSWGIPQTIVFIPNSANITESDQIRTDSYQEVSGYPAGTTTTYPVSTNPNAYQEGSDAKPAGYVLGDVVTGNFSLTVKGNGSTTITWLYSSAVTVSDNGEISFVDSTGSTINAYGYASNAQNFKGKFCKTSFEGTYFTPNEVYFIPANASIVQSGDKLVVDRYQPVTGYAAIPAGTTIEYLGKLGDKARVQVVSYVGTGTSGSDNPVSITFDFVPKSIWVTGQGYSYESEIYLIHGDASKNSGKAYYFSFSRISWKNKTVSWYNSSDDGYQASALQANTLGETYKVLAIG